MSGATLTPKRSERVHYGERAKRHCEACKAAEAYWHALLHGDMALCETCYRRIDDAQSHEIDRIRAGAVWQKWFEWE